MSGSVNRVFIIGNLGADPEVRTTQAGQSVATLSIATSESFNDREGTRQERTEWHRVVCFSKLAELAQRYLGKGRKVYVEGRLQTRSWEDKQTGQKKYATEIVARELTFLDSNAGGGGQGGGGGYGGGQPAGGNQQRGGYGGGHGQQRGGGTQQQRGGYGGGGQQWEGDDDLPF